MALYTPVVGIITNIEYLNNNNLQDQSCTTLYTLEGENPQGPFQVQLPPNAYILNSHPFQIGDRATFFYDPNAPMVLIYPPRYTAVSGAYTPPGTSAVLDVFQNNMTTADNSLMLNISWNTPVTMPNGQPFTGDLGDKLLLVHYSMTARSIPPQTTPEHVVVFC